MTNGETDVQAPKIEHVGLTRLLDACCSAEELGIRKPDPRIFHAALARCGADAANAWMIADADVDVEGAHRAGIRSVWLHRGRTWTRSDLAPDHTAANLLEALEIVDV